MYKFGDLVHIKSWASDPLAVVLHRFGHRNRYYFVLYLTTRGPGAVTIPEGDLRLRVAGTLTEEYSVLLNKEPFVTIKLKDKIAELEDRTATLETELENLRMLLVSLYDVMGADGPAPDELLSRAHELDAFVHDVGVCVDEMPVNIYEYLRLRLRSLNPPDTAEDKP